MGVWRIEEGIADLETRYELKESERATYMAFKNDKRRREWLCVRLMLEEMMGKEVEIAYKDSGKPYLKGSSKHISITHTIGYVGVRVADHPVALDMEYKSDRVLRIISKFVSESEMGYLDRGDKVATALVIWSAKETLYKLHDIQEIEFDKHLKVSNFDPTKESGTFTGTIDKGGFRAEVKLRYRITDDLILVYC